MTGLMPWNINGRVVLSRKNRRSAHRSGIDNRSATNFNQEIKEGKSPQQERKIEDLTCTLEGTDTK